MIHVWTDGSCYPNPGPGGIAWVRVDEDGVVTEHSRGILAPTTNNVAEVAAVVSALAAIREPAEVTVHSDSAYVCSPIAKGWLSAWQERGWVTAGDRPKPIANREWWEEMARQVAYHRSVTMVHLKGHQGDRWNERCDVLAGEARRIAADWPLPGRVAA